jgi:hypothetical protein
MACNKSPEFERLTGQQLLKRDARRQQDPRTLDSIADDDPRDHGLGDGEAQFAADAEGDILPLDELLK